MTSYLRFSIASLLMLTMVACVSGDFHRECASNDDCSLAEVCQRNICQPKSTPTLMQNDVGTEQTDVGELGNDIAEPDTTPNICSPIPEMCDGLDNDCDGLIDNLGSETSCTTDLEGACEQGLRVCTAGEWMCQPLLTPQGEICDGVDNDCDGVLDEGSLNACGGCGALPEEMCDGVDNDCDGLEDEGLTPEPCLLQYGVCLGATRSCVDGRWSMCTEAIYQAHHASYTNDPIDAVCDGQDNNCDGIADELCCSPNQQLRSTFFHYVSTVALAYAPEHRVYGYAVQIEHDFGFSIAIGTLDMWGRVVEGPFEIAENSARAHVDVVYEPDGTFQAVWIEGSKHELSLRQFKPNAFHDSTVYSVPLEQVVVGVEHPGLSVRSHEAGTIVAAVANRPSSETALSVYAISEGRVTASHHQPFEMEAEETLVVLPSAIQPTTENTLFAGDYIVYNDQEVVGGGAWLFALTHAWSTSPEGVWLEPRALYQDYHVLGTHLQAVGADQVQLTYFDREVSEVFALHQRLFESSGLPAADASRLVELPQGSAKLLKTSPGLLGVVIDLNTNPAATQMWFGVATSPSSFEWHQEPLPTVDSLPTLVPHLYGSMFVTSGDNAQVLVLNRSFEHLCAE